MSTKNHLPFYNPLDPTHPKIWPSYTLLMPICAVGNIGQLACDLIISTLISKNECQLVGRIYSPALMSVVGPNAFSPKGPPTTSTEVYESKQHKLVIIQQRTSYFKNLKHIYIDDLVQWIKEAKFDNLLVLTSSFAQCNPDTSQLGQMFSSTIRSITTSSFEANDRWLELNIKKLPDSKSIKVIQDGLSFLPGSGITKPLIKACEKAFVPAAFLVDFCSEGINIQDCYEVVNMVDRFLGLQCGQTGCTTPKVSHDQSPSIKVNTTQVGDHHQQQQQKLSPVGLSVNGWVEPFSWTQAKC